MKYGYRQHSCTSKAAKFHRFIIFVMYHHYVHSRTLLAL